MARKPPTLSYRLRRLGEMAAPFVVLALIWQFASLGLPRYLFPSLIDVFWRTLEIFGNGGIVAASYCFVPKAPPSAALVVEGGELPKARVTVRELKTAWRP